MDITSAVSEGVRAENTRLLLSAIVDSCDDAIISKDLDGVITSWNKGAEQLFGYSAEEIIGQSITLLIPPDRLSEEPEILRRLRRGESVDRFDTIRRHKDGRLLSVSLTISPVKDESGRIIGASKIARDITERKQAEEAVRENHQRLQQLADSMPEMVWTARADGYIDYYNGRWYEFTGVDRDSFGSWDSFLHPEDTERCRTGWLDAVQSGKPYQMEYRFWDGREHRWRWFMGRALPIRDERGDIVKWFGACTDIDSQKRVESDLRRANQALEEFAFSASHDLQEPLRTLTVYSELLGQRYREKLGGEGTEFLERLRSNAQRLQMLIRGLLAFTQISGPQEAEEITDANEVLTATLADLVASISAAGARITNDPLPQVRMHAVHLQQLFQNLIGNALKYRSPERPPEVHISSERHNEEWIFAVRDNGIGIAPEHKQSIFGLFKRLHADRKENSGTGIGLALCKRIVEQYHGRIWVDSEPGQGSTFRFTIPG